MGARSEVVSKPTDGFEVQLFEFKQKWVVYNDEKDGREGAPLLDASVDVEASLAARKRRDSHGLVKEGGYQVGDPLGKPYVPENSQDIVVVDAVKSFSGVEEQDIGCVFSGKVVVEEKIELLDVSFAVPTF